MSLSRTKQVNFCFSTYRPTRVDLEARRFGRASEIPSLLALMYNEARVRPRALAILRVGMPSRTSLRIMAKSWRVHGEPWLVGGLAI